MNDRLGTQPARRPLQPVPGVEGGTQLPGKLVVEASSLRLTFVWVLLLVSVLPWRVETYYSGGLDGVVVAKAVLNVFVLLLAWSTLSRVTVRYSTGSRPVLIVFAFLAVTVLGGWAAASLVGAAVLAVRMGILLVTVLLLTSTYPMLKVVVGLRNALILVAGVTAVSGLGTLAATGRLGGGVLPLSPNVLSMMLGAAVIQLFWKFVHTQRAGLDIVAVVGLVALIWLTGSRTGLAALAVAIVLIVLNSRKPRSAVFVGAVVSVPLGVFVVTATGLFSAYFERGGGQSVASLNSRTIAWQAAFDSAYDFWPSWFGRGLSARTVEVSGTFWNSQVLDSSWVSAFVQGGILGLVLLALWAITTMLAAATMPHPTRSLFLPMTVFSLIWSVTASGLLDAYVLFLLMLVTSLASDRTTWQAVTALPEVPGDVVKA